MKRNKKLERLQLIGRKISIQMKKTMPIIGECIPQFSYIFNFHFKKSNTLGIADKLLIFYQLTEANDRSLLKVTMEWSILITKVSSFHTPSKEPIFSMLHSSPILHPLVLWYFCNTKIFNTTKPNNYDEGIAV